MAPSAVFTAKIRSADEDAADVSRFNSLVAIMNEQINTCREMGNVMMANGDNVWTKNFKKFEDDFLRDSELLLQLAKKKSPLPSVEQRTFKVLMDVMNPRLIDTELEISIIKVVNVCPAKGKNIEDLTLFCESELEESNQHVTSNVVKGAAITLFGSKDKFKDIVRERKTLRLKITINLYSKRGFFSGGNQLLGSAIVSLKDLETKCESDQIVDLKLDGKTTGAKIHAQLCVRRGLIKAERIEKEFSFTVLKSKVTQPAPKVVSLLLPSTLALPLKRDTPPIARKLL